MLNERKLTERELGKREEAIKGLMSNKRKLVKKYGKDAEKVMYGIATKQAKNKVESMDKEKIRELVKQSLLKKEGFVNTTPLGEPESGQEIDVDTGFSGRADYGAEDKYLGGEDEIEQSAASTPPSGGQKFLPGVPTPTEEGTDNEKEIKEGHGLNQDDVDILQKFIDGGDMDVIPLKRVLKFIIKSNILQDKTKDLSKGKVDEALNPEVSQKVNAFIKAMAKRYDYSEKDAVFAIMAALKQREMDGINEVGGFDRKGNKEMDNDDKGLKKRPQAGISALLKSAVREKLTKKSSVEDHVDDFKKSDAKQFKGKSLKKIKQMALASFLSKQND